MNILCATDFSEPSTRAARVASDLARAFGDTLVLGHAWHTPELQYAELMSNAGLFTDAIRTSAVEALQRAATEAAATGVLVEHRLVEGNPAEKMAELGRELDARLIVVGTHGRGAAARLFLGSVAERTILQADRPVLVVREPAESLGQTTGRRLRVAVGVDATAPSRAALAWVRELRRHRACDVTFIHAYWPVEQYQRLGLRGASEKAGPDQEVAAVLERELAPLIGEMPGEGTTHLLIRPSWGAPSDAMVEEADKVAADLLVLGTHQRRWLARVRLGSTVHGALRSARMPVLCVPADATAEVAVAPVSMVHTVLAATDLSESGNLSVPAAYGLVHAPGKVYLCHIHERYVPNPAYLVEPPSGSALTTEQRQDLEQRLKALIPAEAAARGIATEVMVVEGGQAADAINQEANRLGVDHICVGSHGRSGISKRLVGSIAQAVVERAERPVTVVRTRT